ncbi:MAG: VOC family protein [Anaerolineales bacterium]|nr:VOC family protein [Anaerolineales bacterium]
MTDNFTIDERTGVGTVTLAVADLPAMTTYYQEIIGLELLDNGPDQATLGIGDDIVVRLEHRPDGRQHKRAAGLFHLAILLPSRASLGQWLKHYISTTGTMIGGAGDHLVSEALYLDDPEGNGIEIYADRPREGWPYKNGELQMATLAVDIPDLVAKADPAPFNGMPAGTTLGHVHLQVNNETAAEAFYESMLGIERITSYPGATFLGAGGYHHHIGANVWHSRGQSQPPAGSLGLVNFSLRLADNSARDAVLAHLESQNVPVTMVGDTPGVMDPAGNQVLLELA